MTAKLKDWYLYFFWTCLPTSAVNIILTTLIHIPSIVIKGSSNPYAGILSFIYIPLSFFVWQASLVMLFLSGRKRIVQKKKEAILLNFIYVISVIYSVGIYFLYPPVFY